MSKKKVIFSSLLFFLLVNTNSYSQDLFTQKLQWNHGDSIQTIIFEDKDQIIEWSRSQLPFSSVSLEEFSLKDNCDISIVTVVGCSGLPCWNIYVFKKEDTFWRLIITSLLARLKEQLVIKVDKEQEKIIFETNPNNVIGELPFRVFSSSDN